MPSENAIDLERELDRLYGRPRNEFVPARNELAKRLRALGQRDEAAEVAKLPKPTPAASAINQLQRAETAELRRLIAAAEKIKLLQADALAGKPIEGLRQATEDQAAVIRRLVAKVPDAVKEHVSQSTLDRVGEALRNASGDDEARHLIASGRLAQEPQASGFAAFAGMPAARRTDAKRRRPHQSGSRDDVRRSAIRREIESLERQLADRERAAKEAVRAARKAEKERDRLDARLQGLRARL